LGYVAEPQKLVACYPLKIEIFHKIITVNITKKDYCIKNLKKETH